MTTPAPNGCRYCGIEQRDHMQRWATGIGWHTWTQPTDQQIKERMHARRVAATETGCGWNPTTASPVCDWDRNCPQHGGGAALSLQPTLERPWYGKETPQGFILIVVQAPENRSVTDLAIRDGEPVINHGNGWESDPSPERKQA